MIRDEQNKYISAIFITFPGNCRKAFMFYQDCFGGTLRFDTFQGEIQDYAEMPVISGSLFSDRIIIHGSDLIHDEGRKTGNHISIYLHCKNVQDRSILVKKLDSRKRDMLLNTDEQRLTEVVDAFDVRWILGI